MPQVVYWSNIPAPYMVDRFNALAQRRNLDFEAWFSARTEKGRSWLVDERAWEFRHRYLPGANGRWHSLLLPPRLFHGKMPDVLVSLYAAPGFLIGSWIASRRGARTAFWVEATFDAVVRRRRWKEWLKSVALPRADGILTTGEDGRAFVRRYTASQERVFVVPHVVDYARYASRIEDSPAARDRVRARLGLRGVTFLYVGHLSSAKGVHQLTDAFGSLARTTEAEVSLLLVGDGHAEAKLKARCRQEGLENVIFAGFQDAESLPHYYAAADVFIFPTLGDTFGMVVSEAMACRLPVIATSASGEIRERVSEGVNGFIVPPADSSALLDRMALLAGDPALRARMGAASAARVAGQSPNLWAEAFEAAIGGILDLPRASGKS